MRRHLPLCGGSPCPRSTGVKSQAIHALRPAAAAPRILIALVCAAFLAGCAEAPKSATYKRPPPRPPSETKAPLPPPAPLPEKTRSNVRPSTQDAMTPQRQASMKLVDKGKALLDADKPDRAADVLMDAVNVDGSNGVAYYYLADANQRLGQKEIAQGLLDKAEALLGADEEWHIKINELRGGLDASAPQQMISSPIDVSF